MTCERCGCTDEAGCIIDDDGNLVAVVDGDTLPEGCTVCHWVRDGLCSACTALELPPLLFDAHGLPVRGAL